MLYNSKIRPRSNEKIAGKKKGKEEYLYSVMLADTTLTKHSDVQDHTVLPANYTMFAFPS